MNGKILEDDLAAEEELEKLQANIQWCSKCKNKYFAKSHEYPCPYCELAKYEPCDKITEDEMKDIIRLQS